MDEDKHKPSREYDVALSFAGEDREYVEAVASALQQAGVKVFYDQYEEVELWGKNLPVEEISVCAGTIPYTLMCAVSRRVPREYSGHDGFEETVLNN